MSIAGCLGNSVCYQGNSNIRDPTCQELIFNYCTGEGETTDAWVTRWWRPQNERGSTCASAVSKHLSSFNSYNQCYVTPQPQLGICRPVDDGYQINSELWNWAKVTLEVAVRKYQDLGYELAAGEGEPGYTPFNSILTEDVCCTNPSLCQGFLASYCRKFTTANLSKRLQLKNLCGCYMSSINYQEYSAKYNIQRQCSSMCNSSSVIPMVGSAGSVELCDVGVCIIDDINLSLVNNTVGGATTFEQMCGFSDGSNIDCTMSDSVVEVIDTDIGGNLIPVLEQCGTLSYTANGTSQNTTVEEIRNLPQQRREEVNSNVRKSGIITLLIVLVICIVILFVYLISRKHGNDRFKTSRPDSR